MNLCKIWSMSRKYCDDGTKSLSFHAIQLSKISRTLHIRNECSIKGRIMPLHMIIVCVREKIRKKIDSRVRENTGRLTIVPDTILDNKQRENEKGKERLW